MIDTIVLVSVMLAIICANIIWEIMKGIWKILNNPERIKKEPINWLP